MAGNSRRKITMCTAIQNVIKPLQLSLAVVLFFITPIGMSAKSLCVLPKFTTVVEVVDLNANLKKSNFLLEQIITEDGISRYPLKDTYHVYYIGIDSLSTETHDNIGVAIGDDVTWKNCIYTLPRTMINESFTDDILCQPNAIGNILIMELGGVRVINIYGVYTSSAVKIFYTYPNITCASMSVHFADTLVTDKIVSSEKKYCFPRRATEDPQIRVLADTAICTSTTVVIRFITQIAEDVVMSRMQRSLECNGIFSDYNWLLVVKSNAQSESPVNDLMLIVNKIHVYHVLGIRSGLTDIFIINGLQCKQISNLYMAELNSSNLIVDEITAFSDACNMSHTFVHGEILKEQLYAIHNKAKNPVSVQTITGPTGIDNGVILKLYGAHCANNMTLDTAQDDFQPNSTDYFDSMIPECGPLKCIKIQKFGIYLEPRIRYIKVTDNVTGVVIEVDEPDTKRHCVSEIRGHEKWIVTLNTPGNINRLTLDIEGSILNEKYFYLGSLKADNTVYNIYLRDIGELLCLNLTWYPNFSMDNRELTLTHDKDRYSFLISSHHINFQAIYPISTCYQDEKLLSMIVDDCTEDDNDPDQCDRNEYSQLNKSTIVWAYSLKGHTFDHVNLIYSNIILSSVPETNVNARKSEGIFCHDKEYLLNMTYLTAFPPINCGVIKISLVLILPNNIKIHYLSELLSSESICEWKVFPITTYQNTLLTSLTFGYTVNMSVITTAVMNESNYTIVNTTAMAVTTNDSDCETINGSNCTTNNHREYLNTSTIQATNDASTMPTVLSTSESITLNTTVQDVLSESERNQVNTDITVSTLPITRENTFTPLNSIPTIKLISESTPSNTSVDIISCLCPCPKTQKNLTPQELNKKLLQIASELALPRNKTSKYIRSKVSMPDDRQSSLYVSSVILIVVVTPFVLIVLLDIVVILKAFYPN